MGRQRKFFVFAQCQCFKITYHNNGILLSLFFLYSRLVSKFTQINKQYQSWKLVRNSWKFEILFSWKHLLNSSQKFYWNEIQKNCYCVILWTILEQLLTHYTLLFVLIICHSRHVFCLLPTFYLEDSIYTYNSMPKVVKLHKAD